MKRSTTLLLPVLLLVLASCGTPAQYSQQRFQDEIYAKIGEEPEVVRLYSEEDFERMAAANIAKKNGRDTLVIIVDDPWDFRWYSHFNRYHYAPWLWGGLGFAAHYWNRYYGNWYDPFWDGPFGFGYYYGGWYDPWYYSYFDPWYYDPWYYDPWYGYGHRYGWYDHPRYPGGYWGGGSWGGSYRGRDVVYTPRSTTTGGGSRERRPGSGPNYRYGSAGSTSLHGGTNVRPTTRARGTTSASASSSTSSSSGRTTAIPSPVRTREQGYNPSRTYQNKNSNSSNPTRSGSYNDAARSSSRSSSSSSSYGGGATRSGSSSSSYGGASRSSGGSYGGGATRSSGGGGGASYSSGNASHSGGGGGARSGGRR